MYLHESKGAVFLSEFGFSDSLKLYVGLAGGAQASKLAIDPQQASEAKHREANTNGSAAAVQETPDIENKYHAAGIAAAPIVEHGNLQEQVVQQDLDRMAPEAGVMQSLRQAAALNEASKRASKTDSLFIDQQGVQNGEAMQQPAEDAGQAEEGGASAASSNGMHASTARALKAKGKNFLGRDMLSQ